MAIQSSFRRRALLVVIVLLVFYPIGMYVYTESVRRANARGVVQKNIDAGVRYAFEVKDTVEQLLARLSRESADENPLHGLLDDTGRRRLEGRLQMLLCTGGMTNTLIRFTEVYEGGRLLLHWGQDARSGVVEEVVCHDPLNFEDVRRDVFEATAEGPETGVCKLIMPLNLGEGRRGRLAVGLASPSLSTQVEELSKRMSSRALRLSLFGTSLLALLAAYIVYLNDRTRDLELKLEKERRLAYVGTIAAGMAHEIRNPLSSVKMNIQMIEDRLSEFGEKESDYLVNKVSRIHSETVRLEESVNNFLMFARPKPLERVWANLNEAIDHIVDFLEPACASNGVRIVRDYSGDLPQVYIDPDQFGQAIENIVRNAHQAIGKDGSIEIYTGRHERHVEIRISDDGPGVPADVREKMFEIFFTTKEGGTGLGLTIVKQIVEAHGGTVTFDTIPGRGTTFTIRLPIDEEL